MALTLQMEAQEQFQHHSRQTNVYGSHWRVRCKSFVFIYAFGSTSATGTLRIDNVEISVSVQQLPNPGNL